MQRLVKVIARTFPSALTHAYCTAARLLRRFPHTHNQVLTARGNDGADNLEVRSSLIPDAGMGLFATSVCSRGMILCEYQGTRLNVLQLLRTPDWTYVYNYQYQFWIDAREHLEVKGRFVNDHVNPAKRNVCWVEQNGRVFMQSTRDIFPNEELYVGYGEEYWENQAYWTANECRLSDGLLSDGTRTTSL